MVPVFPPSFNLRLHLLDYPNWPTQLFCGTLYSLNWRFPFLFFAPTLSRAHKKQISRFKFLGLDTCSRHCFLNVFDALQLVSKSVSSIRWYHGPEIHDCLYSSVSAFPVPSPLCTCTIARLLDCPFSNLRFLQS